MHIDELPREFKLLVTSDDEQVLARHLQEALEEIDGYLYFTIITGASGSARLILVNHAFDAVPICQGREEPWQIAQDLMLLVPQARYAPKDWPERRKGWMLWKYTLPDNYPAVAAFAAWVK